MQANIITIDLSQEITQAEYCRRTGDTLANLAPKLKKMAVRDIPELGIRLINISAPIFDTIRVEAPPVRDYSITELSGLFGNLLANFQTDAEMKEAKIQSLEKVLEEMTAKLESLGEELEQQKQLNELLQADGQQKDELIQATEAQLEEAQRRHTEQIEIIQTEHRRLLHEAEQRAEAALSDGKVAQYALEEKEKANQELRTDLTKISQERDVLQGRLLDLSKQVTETSIKEEFKSFKEDFLSIIKSLQPMNAATISEEKTKEKKKGASPADSTDTKTTG